MKYEKYYKLVEEQSRIYDKTQNCGEGQTGNFIYFQLLIMLAN